MEVVVAGHPASLRHDTGRHHPERHERIDAVRRGIATSGLPVVQVEAPMISRDELVLVHREPYVDAMEDFCRRGGGMLDSDTVVVESSWEAALAAAGAVRILAEELEGRSEATGVALCRPPGHHALPARAMGFCLFNNVAITAAVLRARGERVAILDWDLHHGNGTQAMLQDDPGVLYVSLHQAHFYPLTGEIGDIDRHAPGTTLNIPLPAGTAGDVYRRAWEEIVVPVTSAFSPDWLLVSAGYDGHAHDLLGDLRLVAADYGWIARRLAEVHPRKGTILALEGGYDLAALADSVAATLAGLSGKEPEGEPLRSPPGAERVLEEVTEAVARYWTL